MKKLIYILASAAVLLATASACKTDFLETSNPGIVDKEFVFSSVNNTKAAMNRVYAQWISVADGSFLGNGLYYALNLPGGDDSRHPEGYGNQLQRHVPESFYENGAGAGAYNIDQMGGPGSYYTAIAYANNVINAMEGSEAYKEYMAPGAEPTELSQLYGEAVCARASMYVMAIRYFGDIPFAIESGVAASGLTARDSIYDFVIADLERVIPHMFRSGSVPGYGEDKNAFSRTFAEAMAGIACLDAAGYQTRRPDINYVDGDGNKLSFENLGTTNTAAGNAFYARRSDYKKYYEKAVTFFKAVIDNPGNVKFYDTDPRAATAAGQQFGNPFQYFFAQMMGDESNHAYADESIFEYALTWNVSNGERPYSNGRVSNGGGSNAFPCKAYGQGRINPAYYWGVFDPKDMRRDVTASVTGHSGGGQEIIIPFTPNSKASGGGLSNNKFDEARQDIPNVLKQRRSGINGPYLRMSEVLLGYAEACAQTGKDAEAKKYLAKVRERSFPKGQANTDAFIASCGSLVKAVLQERDFEFAGEGEHRWTMIRSGLVFEKVKRVKELQAAMIAGVESQGYYKFENGNEFPAYIWTKNVDAKALYGYRLTTQCPDESDPVLYPGWRGENDDWEAAGTAAGCTNFKNLKFGGAGMNQNTNLAIKGLFKHIDPDSAEAKALEADGYKKVEYGLNLAKSKTEYVDNLFKNFDYTSAPIYLVPFTHNNLKTMNGVTNGYGFTNEAL
ncbi:MAG: RagB/SusD family nutrient uptake outer membrane protein [Bacteroidales bacterium]|nr:RagB/SusD family nutrient uptake outer membrane protein [Bacteroidales bacterium]